MVFRERHPTYQREWRVLRALREIRDEIEPALRAMAGPLGKLIARAGAILVARGRAAARERDWFLDLVALARRFALVIRELASLGRQLDDAASRSGARDTRRD